MIENKCRACGGSILTTQKRIDDGRGKYCSKKCMYRSRGGLTTIDVICKHCKKVYKARPIDIERRPNGGYCSRVCWIEYQKNKDRLPHIDGGGYMCVDKRRLHRIIMEQHLGRKLRIDEHVHHINGEKSDNRLENLQVMLKSDHHGLHSRVRYAGTQTMHNITCLNCGQVFAVKTSHKSKAKFCTKYCYWEAKARLAWHSKEYRPAQNNEQ